MKLVLGWLFTCAAWFLCGFWAGVLLLSPRSSK